MSLQAIEKILAELSAMQAASNLALKESHRLFTEDAIRRWPSIEAELRQWHEDWCQHQDDEDADHGHPHGAAWWRNGPPEFYDEGKECLTLLQKSDPVGLPIADWYIDWFIRFNKSRPRKEDIDRLRAEYGPAVKRLHTFIVEGCAPCAFTAERTGDEAEPSKIQPPVQ
jgi:hypothetical protein